MKTIILTDHAPLSIEPDEWRLIGGARFETQGGASHLNVREHRDGRRLVYGEGNGKAGGYLLEAVRLREERQPCDEGPLVSTGADECGTYQAIAMLARLLEMPRLATLCITSLPAVAL